MGAQRVLKGQTILILLRQNESLWTILRIMGSFALGVSIDDLEAQGVYRRSGLP